MARDDPQMKIRLPDDIKSFLKEQARLNASSQNSEVVRSIRERMERVQERCLAGAQT